MKYTGKQRLLHSQKIVFKELFISRVVKWSATEKICSSFITWKRFKWELQRAPQRVSP